MLENQMTIASQAGVTPRQVEAVTFAADIRMIDQLTPRMKPARIVTNVTNFETFVDIGVHRDGLVHINELPDKLVKKPTGLVSANQKIAATVLTVDADRKRIYLSMRPVASPAEPPEADT